MTSEPKDPGAAAIILSYEESDDSNSAEVLVHVRIKILTSGGISAGNLQLPAGIVANDGFAQDFAARTIHKDGTILPFIGKPSTTTSADGREMKMIALPDVQVGSIVEYSYHFAGQNTLTTYLSSWYEPTWHVQRDYFVRSAHFTLKTPDNLKPESVRWIAVLPHGALLTRLQHAITLDVADIPAAPDEEYMPPPATALFNVRFFYYVGANDHFWAETSADVDRYWSSFDDSSKPLVTAVNTLVQPSDTEEQKLRKIYAAVESLENTDYTREHSAKENKQSGTREAQDSKDIWNLKRGDSYDLTHLFIALARSAGFHAYPMAVASRGQGVFDQNLLSWSQTDSLIAIVTVNGKEEFFDPGTRLCPFGHLAPWHSNVLGVSIETKLVKIRSTPTEPFAAMRTERLADLTLDATGGVSGTVRIAWIGTAGLSMRTQFLRQDTNEVQTDLEKRTQALVPSGVELHLKSLTGLADGEVPLVAEFTVSGNLGVATSKRVLVPAQFFTSTSKSLLAPDQRSQALNFPSAHSDYDQMRLRIPADLAVESLPAVQTLSVSTSTAYAAGAQVIPKNQQMLVAERTFILNRIDYKQEEYPGLHQYFGHIVESDQAQIILHKAVAPESAP